MKILIFKTDKIGDLINISSLVKNLKDHGYNIDIICSEYNSRIAKFYDFFDKIYLKYSLISFFKKNHDIFNKEYDFVLQLDGSKWSFFTGLFIRAKNKYSLQYIKTKFILGFKYKTFRPSFLYNSFYKYIECNENYNIQENKKFHYLSLYYEILKYENLKFFNKKHYFPSSKVYKNKNIKLFDSYILVHLDEKWKSYNNNYYNKFKNKILELSKKNHIIVTSNNENLYLNDFKNKNNIITVYDTKIEDLIYIAYNCRILISFHAGFLVHLCACFEKKIIDVMPKIKFNEIDRWIPFETKYERHDIDLLNNLQIDFI